MTYFPDSKRRRQSDLEQEMSLAKLDEGNAQKEYEEPSGEHGPVPRD